MNKIYPVFEYIRKERNLSYEELHSLINKAFPDGLKITLQTTIAWCRPIDDQSHRKPHINRLKYLKKAFKKPIEQFLYPEDYFDRSDEPNGSVEFTNREAVGASQI